MPEILTVADVAQQLQISPRTIRREIARGRLRAVRVGRQFRVPRDSLQHYLNTRTVRQEA